MSICHINCLWCAVGVSLHTLVTLPSLAYKIHSSFINILYVAVCIPVSLQQVATTWLKTKINVGCYHRMESVLDIPAILTILYLSLI